MARGRFMFDAYTALFLLILLLPPTSCGSTSPDSTSSGTSTGNNTNCTPSCGNITLNPPFRLIGDPPSCGTKDYELSCEENNTLAILSLYLGKYEVLGINYMSFKIRVVDTDVHKIKDNYFSSPRYSLTSFNFTDNYPYAVKDYYSPFLSTYINYVPIVFFECAKPTNSSVHAETAPCINRSTYSSSSSTDMHSYVMAGSHSFDLGDSCKITQMVMTSPSTSNKSMTSCEAIYTEIARGFELSWFHYACRSRCGVDPNCDLNEAHEVTCYTYRDNLYEKILYMAGLLLAPPISMIRTMIPYPDFPTPSSYNLYLFSLTLLYCAGYLVQFQAIKFVLGFPCVIALLVYKWRRRHMSMYDNIENFLQNNSNLMPVKYSFSNIKRMTRGFKDKLGEGGYGSVYKGKLRSGRLVAIKMLGKSKANGQDFINEVATIGRIHHVNVVQLVGFCVEGSKRALVYDFMPNGSLEKYIFSQQGVIPLNYEKMFGVALGVARGIAYLHQGCEMQILHFDIKPHNILLDENFSAKVSDFGLARLCPLDNSIVSLTAARGTMGYIAPELFYKNIGGVSYKADVYSFGVLLMEMAGRRKNLNANVEHTSQIYFPTWVSEQLSTGNDIEIEDATDEEKKITKKMILVALWCIQMKPGERPSMSKVVEMLEGETEAIQMPPKPFLYPQESPLAFPGENSSSTSASPETQSIEITLVGDAN